MSSSNSRRDRERRYVRKPKPESKIQDIISYYFAYGPDGVFAGEVKLTASRKEQYEEKGWTFKRRNGGGGW